MEKGHVFYAGGTVALYEAQKFAKENNLETVAMAYPGTQKWLDCQKEKKILREGWTEEEFRRRIESPMWENLSRSFAYSTPNDQQDVFIFIGVSEYRRFHRFKPGHSASTLHKIEHPILKAMGKTVHVIFV